MNTLESNSRDIALRRLALAKRIARDRDDVPAYLELADLCARSGQDWEAFLCLKEVSRLGALSEEDRPWLAELEASPQIDPQLLQVYRERIGEVALERSGRPRRILVITNLLPPQEMGGYGRTVWEFCDLLIKRGHRLKILTADEPSLAKTPEPGFERVERFVERSLQLFGEWGDGKTDIRVEGEALYALLLHNHTQIIEAVSDFRPDGCMLGNLDFLGWTFLGVLAEARLPLLHRMGNRVTGYPVKSTPQTPLYCLAGCSQWTNDAVLEQGHPIQRTEVLPPGSPLEYYYRAYLPDRDTLRICYAGLLMEYKGAHVLLEALSFLKKLGLDFTCELAGDCRDTVYMQNLKNYVAENGLSEQVTFAGFLNKRGLSALYSRSNVLVFPSQFEEPFGKSQIEAMAAGLLVVSSGTGGSTDIVKHGRNGLLFRKDDPRHLAERLVYLAHHPDVWEQLVMQGSKDAFRFTTLRSVEKIEAIFESLIAEASARALSPHS